MAAIRATQPARQRAFLACHGIARAIIRRALSFHTRGWYHHGPLAASRCPRASSAMVAGSGERPVSYLRWANVPTPARTRGGAVAKGSGSKMQPASTSAPVSSDTSTARRRAIGREVFAWAFIGLIAFLAVFIQSCPDHAEASDGTWASSSAWDAIFQCPIHQAFILPAGDGQGS